jgi:carboxypeptidase family protein
VFARRRAIYDGELGWNRNGFNWSARRRRQNFCQNTDTGFVLTTDTREEGTFLFPRLPVGNYELAADKAGFASYAQKSIQLTVNQTAD